MRLNYRKKRKYINCVVSIDDYELLKLNAENLWLTTTAYLRDSAIAFSKQRTLFPKNVLDLMWEFRFVLRNIANNINQIAKYVNTKHKLWFAKLIKLKLLVNKLEHQVLSFMENLTKHYDYKVMEYKTRAKQKQH